jgi:hypothetical protein
MEIYPILKFTKKVTDLFSITHIPHTLRIKEILEKQKKLLIYILSILLNLERIIKAIIIFPNLLTLIFSLTLSLKLDNILKIPW